MRNPSDSSFFSSSSPSSSTSAGATPPLLHMNSNDWLRVFKAKPAPKLTTIATPPSSLPSSSHIIPYEISPRNDDNFVTSLSFGPQRVDWSTSSDVDDGFDDSNEFDAKGYMARELGVDVKGIEEEFKRTGKRKEGWGEWGACSAR